MEQLRPGAIFRIGDDQFEYEGMGKPLDNPNGEDQVVGRINPEVSITEGAVHRVFPRNRMREAVHVGPFEKILPYSTYVQEQKTWQGLFGPELKIPFPPVELVEEMGKLKEKGVNSFVPHYLPRGGFERTSFQPVGMEKIDFPGSWIDIQEERWNEARLHGDLVDLVEGGWVIVDATQRSDQDRAPYPNDPFAHLLTGNSSQPAGIRQVYSPVEIFENILPKIKSEYQIDAQVRLPTAAEFNLLGNLFHQDFGKHTSDEWFFDGMGNNSQTNNLILYGGDSNDGGLSSVWYEHAWGGLPDVGFRPMIGFSEKNIEKVLPQKKPVQQRSGIRGLFRR